MKKISTTMAGKIVEVFKIDVQDVGDSNQLVQTLTACLPGSKVNFDLEDYDNVLGWKRKILQRSVSSIYLTTAAITVSYCHKVQTKDYAYQRTIK